MTNKERFWLSLGLAVCYALFDYIGMGKPFLIGIGGSMIFSINDRLSDILIELSFIKYQATRLRLDILHPMSKENKDV